MRRRRWALILLCTASFLAVVDTTIVSIALPAIRQALGISPVDAQWVLNAYALVFGGLLLMLGRLGDLVGRKRLFVVGTAVFTAGSVVAAIAEVPPVLFAGRALQGVGAAAFVPTSLALLTVLYSDEDERGRAVGLYGAMAALGFIGGMVGGGVITQLLGWRWVFWINVPITACMLVGSGPLLPRRQEVTSAVRLDLVGAITVTGGLALLIYALTTAPDRGLLSPPTLATAAMAAVLLVAFAITEQRHPAPLVPPEIVKRRAVMVPNAAIAFQSMVGVAWLYVLTLFFQEVLNRGPLQTGLLFIPMTLASVIAAPAAGRMVARVGPRATAAYGLLLVVAGLGAMIAGMTPTAPLATIIVGMVVGEGGFMMSNVSLVVIGTSVLSDSRSGLAAGLLNTFIQLGNGFGLGIVAAVVGVSLSGTAAAPDAAGALRWGLAACVGFAVVAFALVVTGLPPRTAAVE